MYTLSAEGIELLFVGNRPCKAMSTEKKAAKEDSDKRLLLVVIGDEMRPREEIEEHMREHEANYRRDRKSVV